MRQANFSGKLCNFTVNITAFERGEEVAREYDALTLPSC